MGYFKNTHIYIYSETQAKHWVICMLSRCIIKYYKKYTSAIKYNYLSIFSLPQIINQTLISSTTCSNGQYKHKQEFPDNLFKGASILLRRKCWMYCCAVSLSKWMDLRKASIPGFPTELLNDSITEECLDLLYPTLLEYSRPRGNTCNTKMLSQYRESLQKQKWQAKPTNQQLSLLSLMLFAELCN